VWKIDLGGLTVPESFQVFLRQGEIAIHVALLRNELLMASKYPCW